MEYGPYSESDLYLLINDAREISDRPYLLHAAFLLSCLFEALEPPEEDEEWTPNQMWGAEIPKSIVDGIVKNANEQFIYASNNGTQIDVWDKPFSIRKVNAYDKKRLHLIFNFPVKDGMCTITKDGLKNLCGYSQIQSIVNTREEYPDNKAYLRKVVMLAEDDANDGWDKLTDMEVTMYMWAVYYRKYEFENDVHFHEVYGKDLYTTGADEKKCWTDAAVLHQKPYGLYTFSAKKVREWNEANQQESIIDTLDATEAENYWYDVACKTTCK